MLLFFQAMSAFISSKDNPLSNWVCFGDHIKSGGCGWGMDEEVGQGIISETE